MYISLRLLTSVVYQPSYFNWAKVFLAKFYMPDFLPEKCSFKSKWGFTCSSSGNKSQLKLNIDEHPLHFAEGYPGIRIGFFFSTPCTFKPASMPGGEGRTTGGASHPGSVATSLPTGAVPSRRQAAGPAAGGTPQFGSVSCH